MIGRQREIRELRVAVGRAMTGRGSAVVVEGPPGIGKTSLLEAVAAASAGALVTRCIGVEAERELPYSGLQQLVAGLPDTSASLPEPQSRAIRVALGVADGPPPRPFLVGLGLLGLLAAAAVERPVLCLVDDVHWLDKSTVNTLGFAARRVDGVPVVLLFGKRAGLDVPDLAHVAVRPLAGLRADEAEKYLRSVTYASIDDSVAGRILEEAGGNPLLIREAVRDAIEMGAGYPIRFVEHDLPVVRRLEAGYADRVARLPARTARTLLLAAADPTGDARLIARAAGPLGLSLADLEPAESAGLVRMNARLAFVHPLIRSAVYRSADAGARRRAHAALAGATDRQRDPDRRAWHNAQAAVGPSEVLAAELEQSAARAGARGGFLAAAAFYQRAAEFAELASTRVRCALAAAGALELAGAHRQAIAALDAARAEADSSSATQIDLVRARLLLTVERSQRAADAFLEVGTALVESDPAAAREVYLDAISAATVAASGDHGSGALDAARAARAAPPPAPGTETVPDVLLAAMQTLALDPPSVSMPAVRRHLDALRIAGAPPDVRARWLWIAARVASIGRDAALWEALVDDGVAVARSIGAFAPLAATLTSAAALAALHGDLGRARTAAEEAIAVWESISVPPAPYGVVTVAAWDGRPHGDEILARALQDAGEHGEGMVSALVAWARALRCVAAGNYDEAVIHAVEASRYPRTMNYSSWAHVELVEAAVRTGDERLAATACRELADVAEAMGTDWARGVAARAEALTARDPAVADERYERSIELLERSGMRAEVARARLLHGESLRRRRRKTEAREALQSALETFEQMGAEAFASRTRGELAALAPGTRGESWRSERLSAQEERVARLAGDGLSNARIAGILHLSPSTVDYHLRKAFRKLGIASRTQLYRALQEAADDDEQEAAGG